MKEWETELYRYRLSPAPERRPLQAYIELYLEAGEEKQFASFLHFYEPKLNELSMGYVQEYAMYGHFSDIKSACVFGLLRAMQSYKKEKGPFVPYAQYELKRAVDDYIRTMRTGFTVPTDTEYYKLRTAMRLFAEHDFRTDDATIAAIAAKIRRKPKHIREMLRGGLQNMQFTDFYCAYSDKDDEEGAEDVTVDHGSNPETVFFRDELAADLYAAFQALDYRERDMLSLHLGFCPDCFATRDKDGRRLKTWTYTDLMLRYGLASPDTAEKVCERGLEKLRNVIKMEHLSP